MAENASKSTARDSLAVIAGVVTGIIVYAILAYLFFAIGVRSGDTDAVRFFETLGTALILIILIAGFLAGFIASRISTRKNLGVALLTAIVLVLFWLALDKSFNPISLVLIPAVLLGGWIGLRKNYGDK